MVRGRLSANFKVELIDQKGFQLTQQCDSHTDGRSDSHL